jgi:hypothetical protein
MQLLQQQLVANNEGAMLARELEGMVDQVGIVT